MKPLRHGTCGRTPIEVEHAADAHCTNMNVRRSRLHRKRREHGDEAGVSTRPNILLINVDDLGWTDLGFMGSRFYETPNIDRLARDGCVFTNAYASAANCAPSRANMMTGLQPSRHGIYTVGNSDRGDSRTRRLIPVENNTELPSDMPTIARALQELGYRTGMVGKWHLSNDPTEHGFESNAGGCHSGMPPSYFAPYGIPVLEDAPKGEYLPERMAQAACEFLKTDDRRPFFLYFATYLVHTPIQGRDELVEKYKKKAADGHADGHHFNPVYAAMIESLDTSVGRVLDALSAGGRAHDTLVLFTSDNGGVYAISRQVPLRAGKGASYEGGIRVPMTVRWPGHTPAGSHCREPISNIDFFPTLLTMAGGDPDAYRLDGDDMSDLFQGKIRDGDERDLLWHFPVYLESGEPMLDDGRDPLFRTRPGTVLRRGDWKLHHYYEDDAWELYHLPSDMGERVDRSADEPRVLAQMKGRMLARLNDLAMPLPVEPNPDFCAATTAAREAEATIAPPPSTDSEDEWYRVMGYID